VPTRQSALTRSVGWAAALAALAALGVPACGGTPEPSPAPAPSVTFEALGASSTPSGGGGTGPVAPESTCAPAAPNVLSLDAASRELGWQSCNVQGTLYTLQEGHRALTDAELDSVAASVDEVSVGGQDDPCGADAGWFTLDVRSKTGTKLYMSCRNSAEAAATGREAAGGVRDVWSKLRDLSGQ